MTEFDEIFINQCELCETIARNTGDKLTMLMRNYSAGQAASILGFVRVH